MDIGKTFTETMRKVLWVIARFSLMILDYAYSILMKLFTLDLNDFPFIWKWLQGLSVLLVFLCSDPAGDHVLQNIL